MKQLKIKVTLGRVYEYTSKEIMDLYKIDDCTEEELISLAKKMAMSDISSDMMFFEDIPDDCFGATVTTTKTE